MRLKEAQMLGILALIAVGIILLCMWSGGADEPGSDAASTARAEGGKQPSQPDVATLYESLVTEKPGPVVAASAQASEVQVGGTEPSPSAQSEPPAPPPEESAWSHVRDVIEQTPPEQIPLVEPRPGAPEEPVRAKAERRTTPVTHVVQKGETLSEISQKYYGTATRWRDILRANALLVPEPKLLRPGMRLVIPPRETAVAAATHPALAADTTSSKPARIYTVQKGDSLFRIALKCYGNGARWKDILAANPNIKDPARDVRSGMRIVIP